jgi:hypothetical protein
MIVCMRSRLFPVDAAARLLLSLLPQEARRSILEDALDEKHAPRLPEPAELIDAICQERNGLRLEIIQMEGSIHRGVFVFVTVAAAFAGLYWDPRVVPNSGTPATLFPNPATRATLLFALSQVEFFLALILLLLFGNMTVHAAYIQALEQQINQLAGRRVSLWESAASPRFVFGWKSAFFWLQILVVTVVASFFCFAVFRAAGQLTWLKWPSLPYWISAVEAFSLVVLGLWSLLQVGWIRREMEAEFRRKTET